MNSDCSNIVDSPSTPFTECPECDQQTVATVFKPHKFTYGRGADAVQIQAELPFRVCRHCGFEYLDKVGQEAQHDAVCRHLGVMAPSQIRALRAYHNLSRAEFAELTGLGDATIARWERGDLVQNVANDRYLRLLGDENNIARLRGRRKQGSTTDSGIAVPQKRPLFPALGEEREAELREVKREFRLTKRESVLI
jgi:putative zinc finger/helix-turn-helix YgiT family protein